MPHRLGHKFEIVVTDENCIAAVRETTIGKKHRAKYSRIFVKDKAKIKKIIAKRIQKKDRYDQVAYFRSRADVIGKRIAQDLRDDTWVPQPYKPKVIHDNLRDKDRNLKIPCLYDQCVQHAVMRQTTSDLMARNYYYNCGSVPNAGQSRAVDALRREMQGEHLYKYAMTLDVRHFYESCTQSAVMSALGRIYKDKKFLRLHERILSSMGGVLAIGFYPSPWYGNLVLGMLVDRPVKEEWAREGFFVRYADDMVLLLNNKRKLHTIRNRIGENLARWSMRLKHNWQIFPTKARAIPFLSYRFFRGYTLVRKGLMYRITRCARKSSHGLTPMLAMAMVAYKGILKRCDSYILRRDSIFPYTNFKKCVRTIAYVMHAYNDLMSQIAV